MSKKNFADEALFNILSVIAPEEVKKNPVLASDILSDTTETENEIPEITDDDFAKAMGAENIESTDKDEASVDEPAESIGSTEPVKSDEPVGPYDLIFNIRKIITSFTQVINEAERLRKLTEEFSENMSNQQKASWIEQRRFFIAMSKDAEKNWKEFKDNLMKFTI